MIEDKNQTLQSCTVKPFLTELPLYPNLVYSEYGVWSQIYVIAILITILKQETRKSSQPNIWSIPEKGVHFRGLSP